MQRPVIGTKRRSSATRIALCWVGAIIGMTTAVVELLGLMPGDRLAYAKQKQASGGMTALSGNVRHPAHYVPGEVLVKFRDEASSPGIKSLNVDMGAKELRAVSVKTGVIHQYKLEGALSVDEAVLKYRSNPAVEYAEPNYLYSLQAMPSDAQFGTLWGLHNTGQAVNERQERQMPTLMPLKPGISVREAQT